jgi:hypothetical protein
VKQVTLLNEGDEHGVGAVRRMRWSTALPYELVFDMETTKVEPPLFIEGRALGELDGIGRWTLQGEGSACRVRYDWIVTVTKPWMVRLSFILRPVCRWNHGVVMPRPLEEAGLKQRRAHSGKTRRRTTIAPGACLVPDDFAQALGARSRRIWIRIDQIHGATTPAFGHRSNHRKSLP